MVSIADYFYCAVEANQATSDREAKVIVREVWERSHWMQNAGIRRTAVPTSQGIRKQENNGLSGGRTRDMARIGNWVSKRQAARFGVTRGECFFLRCGIACFFRWAIGSEWAQLRTGVDMHH
jgi:hypothetical protein